MTVHTLDEFVYDNDSFIFGPLVLFMHFLPLRYPLLLRRASFGELPSSSASSLVSSSALVVLLVPSDWREMREAVIRCKVAWKVTHRLTTDIPLQPFSLLP